MKKFFAYTLLALAAIVLAVVWADATLLHVTTAVLMIAPAAFITGSPTHTRIKELNEKRGRLHKQMKDLNEKAFAENRSFSSDEDSQYTKMAKDWDDLTAKLESFNDEAKRDAAMAAIDLQREETRERGESREEAKEKESMKFRDWFSKQDTTEVEMRALDLGTNKGYAVPVSFMNKVEEAMLAFGGVYANALIYKTDNGGDFTFPTINDTGNSGAVLAEATTVGNSVDPTLSALTLKAYKISSKPILVTHEMLQDNAIELENLLAKMVATRIMRGANALFTTGGGTTTIQGVVTGATSSSITPAATAITYDNMVDLMHSIDPEYRTNAKWMFNDATLKAIRKLKDSEGRPLWQPSLQLSEPSLLLGKPYIINQAVANIGASAKSVVFGDFNKYLIREVKAPLFLRLKERYADVGQEAFIMFKRFDGQVLDAGTHPLKYWTHASS